MKNWLAEGIASDVNDFSGDWHSEIQKTQDNTEVQDPEIPKISIPKFSMFEFQTTENKIVASFEYFLSSFPFLAHIKAFNPIIYGLFEVLSYMGGGSHEPPPGISAVGP